MKLENFEYAYRLMDQLVEVKVELMQEQDRRPAFSKVYSKEYLEQQRMSNIDYLKKEVARIEAKLLDL